MKNKIWNGSCAECIGPLHLRQNLPMQDSHRLYFSAKNFVAAVSDGLGSRTHSDFGSDLACRCFVKSAKKWIKRKSKSPQKQIRFFYDLLLKKINRSGYSVKECAATFLGAICVSDRLYLFRLGDGMIAALSNGGQHILLSDTKTDSFSNMTSCLEQKLDFSKWEIVKANAGNIETVFMCTDGISDDLESGCSVDFVKDLSVQYKGMSERQIESDMKEWISHWPVPRHTDDKTALFIHKKRENYGRKNR